MTPGGPAAPSSWERHPADLARFLASLAALALGLALTAVWPDGMRAVSADLVRLLGRLPTLLTDAATGCAQLVALATPVALVAIVSRARQWRLLLTAAAAAGTAALIAALLQGWLDDAAPRATLEGVGRPSWITGAAFPSAAFVSALAASITVLIPWLPRAWRRGTWAVLLVVGLLRLLTAVAVPVQVGSTLLLGITVGSATLLVAGAPRRGLQRSDVIAALAANGLGIRTFGRPEDEGHLLAELTGGDRVGIEVIDHDDRDADLLFRLFTAAQRRGLANARPHWSPERVVRNEALVTALAEARGASVPAVLAVADTPSGAGLLVTEADGSVSLAALDDADLTDAQLEGVWSAVAALHAARIAHGRLHTGHVRIDPISGEAVVADLSRGRLAADDEQLALDVAELLTSLALQLGPERAVGSARALEPDRLGAALPLLQPLALSLRTRRALKVAREAHPGLLDDLRERVQGAAGLEEYRLAPLKRISLARVVGLVGIAVVLYVLLAFASNWSEISEALREANWAYLPALLILAAATYPAGALSLMGAVTNRLPLSQTSEVMLAQSFLNRFTPANAGGMALRARYLQLNGTDLGVAAASIGLTSAASGIVQVVLVVGFLLWWGGDSDSSSVFNLPDVNVVAVVLLLILVIGGIVWFTPLRRKILDERVTASLRQIVGEVRQLAQRPSKVALLFGGAALGKLSTITAFVVSCRAFDVDLPYSQLGAIYLTANTVASAAPTPGGVGAIEAALIAVLTAARVDPPVALSIVLVFRLVTYWLPVPPAWLALRHLRKTEVV